MDRPLTEYRVYILDKNDHIRGARDLLASDDHDALFQARSGGDVDPKEIWQGARQVWILKPSKIPLPGIPSYDGPRGPK